jgi:predicted nucleic acid-binding Zn ribbon protein
MELEELKRASTQSGEIEILREANDNLRAECEQKIATIKKQLDERVSIYQYGYDYYVMNRSEKEALLIDEAVLAT